MVWNHLRTVAILLTPLPFYYPLPLKPQISIRILVFLCWFPEYIEYWFFLLVFCKNCSPQQIDRLARIRVAIPFLVWFKSALHAGVRLGSMISAPAIRWYGRPWVQFQSPYYKNLWHLLKGVRHEIFDFRFFITNQFPLGPWVSYWDQKFAEKRQRWLSLVPAFHRFHDTID